MDKEKLARANRITKNLGTTTQEMVRVFVAKIALSGRVPLELEWQDSTASNTWEINSKTLESFYAPAKRW